MPKLSKCGLRSHHLPASNFVQGSPVMDIYITRNGQQLGPYSLDETNKNLRGGVIDSSDLAWHAGLSEWVPLSAVTGIMSSPPSPPRAQQPSLIPTGCQTRLDKSPVASPRKSDSHGNFTAKTFVSAVIVLIIYLLIHGCPSNKPTQFVYPYPVRNQ